MSATSPLEPIRVVHLLDGRHFGGAEQMVRRLAKASHRIGVEARVYLLAEGRLVAFLRDDEIPFRVFPSSGRFDFRAVPTLARALKEDHANILQAHTSRTHLLARILSRMAGISNITTIHSPIAQDENEGDRRHPMRAWIERAGRRWTDHICPVSREETARLIREERVASDRITWIPNGVEDVKRIAGNESPRSGPICGVLHERGLSESAFVAGIIASLRPRKGPETLIRAFARFIQTGGEGLLLLIGDDEFTRSGTYLDQLKRLAHESEIENRVHFAGFQNDPWTLAHEADLIVLPSLFGEGLPLTLLEAMCRGLPILASDIQGNRECVASDENGWLHPPGNDLALSEQLTRAALDRETLKKMGARGRKIFLERFEMNRILAEWKSLYERLHFPLKQ